MNRVTSSPAFHRAVHPANNHDQYDAEDPSSPCRLRETKNSRSTDIDKHSDDVQQHYETISGVLKQSEFSWMFSKAWRDPQWRSMFRNFMDTQASLTSLTLVAIVLTFLLILQISIRWQMYMRLEWRDDSQLSRSLATIRVALHCAVLTTVWTTLALKRARRYNFRNAVLSRFGPSSIEYMQSLTVLLDAAVKHICDSQSVERKLC